MNRLQSAFHRKKVVVGALEPFGFQRTEPGFTLTRQLPGSGFEMTVTVTAEGAATAVVMDPVLQEPYTLHLLDNATGGFVGGVRTEYERMLRDISENCFEPDVFKSAQAKELIEFVRTVYQNELEFLWAKFPDNAVWRRDDDQTWYGALLTVSKRKLGIDADEVVEIIDLRADVNELARLVDNKRFFPGWHMNKRSWYTVILDGSVPTDELCDRIASSFSLAAKPTKVRNKPRP